MIVKNIVGFLLALPFLPYAVWVQRHEIVNAAFQKHVWLGKKGRAEFEAHLAEVEEQRKGML